MPFNKSGSPHGKKQVPMPAPKSALYKKIVAAKKRATVSPSAPSSAPRKRSKPVAAYSTVESRQRALERIKRTIWLHLDDINAGILRLATAGNYAAAKALFDIAGVFDLPPLDDDPKPMAAAPASISATPPDSGPLNPVDAFFQSIGIQPPREDPESAAA